MTERSSNPASVTKAARDRIRELDDHRCAYCRAPEFLTVTNFEIDHIVPRHAGGSNAEANLCWCCPACNRYKGGRQSGYDEQSDSESGLFHPHKQVWSDHFAWQGDGELTAKTAAGRVTIRTLNLNRPRLIRLRLMWAKLGVWPDPEG